MVFEAKLESGCVPNPIVLARLFLRVTGSPWGRGVSVVYVVDRSFIGLGLRPLFIIR